MLHSYFFTGDNFDLLKRIQFYLYPELNFYIFKKAIDKYKNAVRIIKIETELYKKIKNTERFYVPNIEKVYDKIAAYFRFKYPLESQLSFEILKGRSHIKELESAWRNFYYDEASKLVEDNNILDALLVALFNKDTEKGKKAIDDILTFLDYKYPENFVDDYYERSNMPTYENKSEYITKDRSNNINNLKIKLDISKSYEILRNIKEFFKVYSYPSSLYISANKNNGIEIYIQEEPYPYFKFSGYEIKIKLDGIVLKEGSIKVSAKDIVKLLLQQNQNKFVSLAYENEKLHVKNSSSRFEIQAEAEEIKSELNYQLNDYEMMELEQKQLKEMLKHVRFASDKENNKLNGVKFELLDNNLSINATDKYRLATYNQKTFKGNFLQHGFLSDKMINLLFNILNETGKIFIRKINDNLIFKSNEFVFGGQLILDEFPYYKDAVESIEYNCEIVLKTNEIRKVIKSLKPLDDQSFVKIIKLKVEKDYLYITRKITENQNAYYKLVVDTDCYQSEVSINLDYLLEFLEIIEEDKFKIKIAGPEEPIVCELNSQKDYKYYIMPVKN